MTLTLRAVSLNDQPLTQPITAHFDLHGGTIGRADHNTMALPDPERHISREQAEIVAGGSGFVIRNLGSSNPIIVRDRSLAHGESAPLLHAYQVRIGQYLLEVIEDTGDGVDPDATARARPASDLLTPSRPGVAAAPLSRDNPFADLLGTPAAASQAPPPAAAGSDASAPAARLPDDFDPFAPPAAAPAPPATNAMHAGADGAGVFGDLVPAAAPASIDALFGLDVPSGRDPLADFLADAPPAAPTPGSSTDPLVLFGAPARPAPPVEVAPDHVPQLHAAFTPPRPAQAARPVRRPAAGPATTAPLAPPEPAALPASTGDAAALWNAFCEGADVRLQQEGGPEAMRLAGMLLRASIAGMLQLMAVRAATRHELHAQVTVIQSRNNNPLKFSPDAQAALEQLLQPPLRGFLPGAAAVTEAMDDLVGHAIGTMAGTRSALEGVLARFAPRELEDKLAGRTMLDTLLPMSHKAKLWELYLQHHEDIREEAQEDFHALFGKAFLAAYEQQLERLRRERPRS